MNQNQVHLTLGTNSVYFINKYNEINCRIKSRGVYLHKLFERESDSSKWSRVLDWQLNWWNQADITYPLVQAGRFKRRDTFDAALWAFYLCWLIQWNKCGMLFVCLNTSTTFQIKCSLFCTTGLTSKDSSSAYGWTAAPAAAAAGRRDLIMKRNQPNQTSTELRRAKIYVHMHTYVHTCIRTCTWWKCLVLCCGVVHT